MDYQVPYRKILRLRGYDYSQNGYYFVTICTADRRDFFGTIENGIVRPNEMGDLVMRCWSEIPQHFANVKLDEWIVMPNHLHGVLVIDNDFVVDGVVVGDAVGDANLRPLPRPVPLENDSQSTYDPTKTLLPKTIHGFKSSVTRCARRADPHSSFGWQRSYYDHIIRNEKSLNNIREYIRNNPMKWTEDVESIKSNFSDADIKNHYDRLFFDLF